MSAIDMTPRYVPEALISVIGRGQLSPVVRVESFPPGQHPDGAPIVATMTAVRATLANGGVRWFGCERAYIDASLRFVVVGTNPRDEVRMTWEPAGDGDACRTCQGPSAAAGDGYDGECADCADRTDLARGDAGEL